MLLALTPNHIDMSGRHVDLAIIQNLLSDVVQDAVAHVDCVIEADQSSGRAVLAGKVRNMRSRPTQEMA